ncbi:MAG: methylated-DNA--[protein]-cysteine S-methyltransferase [Dehalococcoidia bacterium]
MFYYNIFQTSFGWVAIISSSKGLIKSCLPKINFSDAKNFIENQNFPMKKTERLNDISNIVIRYLNGEKIDLTNLEIDYLNNNNFKVFWETCRKIPFGETKSYKWLANNSKKFKAYRFAGLSMSKNPLPLFIPCHRVISSNGNIGGFQGGEKMKLELINLEKNNLIL